MTIFPPRWNFLLMTSLFLSMQSVMAFRPLLYRHSFLGSPSLLGSVSRGVRMMTPEYSSDSFEPMKLTKKAARKTAAAAALADGKLRALAPAYAPKTENQRIYLNHLTNSSVDIVLGVGPAGSGKTLFACYAAIQALIQGKIQKIIMTRPLVSVDKEDIGYLPGNMIRKMDPWTRPIFDILLEFYSQREIDAMLEKGVIEISPLAYMRGRTFKKAFIIADEMQNSSPNQMLMMMTRIGLGTKMVITGDLNQSDRPDWENGLKDFLHKWKGYSRVGSGNTDEIRCVEMEAQDIQRSAVVSKILDIYTVKEGDRVVVKPPYSYAVRTPGSLRNDPLEPLPENPKKLGMNQTVAVHHNRTMNDDEKESSSSGGSGGCKGKKPKLFLRPEKNLLVDDAAIIPKYLISKHAKCCEECSRDDCNGCSL